MDQYYNMVLGSSKHFGPTVIVGSVRDLPYGEKHLLAKSVCVRALALHLK
jgi:hypothetical protein